MLRFSLLIPLMVLCGSVMSQETENVKSYALNTLEWLTLYNVHCEPVIMKGENCLRVTRSHEEIKDETLVIFPDELFHNGTLEVELSGEPLSEADPNMRGFVGLAFRIDPNNYYSYECIYIRPTNGRAPEQIRRNHATQYISHPEYPWYRQRKEAPGVYESYVDLVPGEWTKIKIEVNGLSAKLYVHEDEQPCLVVNDLKKGDQDGLVGLWLHSTTLAHFRNLVITHKK